MKDRFYTRSKLYLQYLSFILLVLVDAAMLWFLVNGLVVKSAEVQMDPAVSAIVGGLAGAITTALAMAVRDLYQPGDEPKNGNGKPLIPPVV